MNMNMQAADWGVIGALLALMTYAALSTRKYNKGVADFLAAGRCARKYVLGVAEGLSCVGAITIIAWFEMYYNGGFAAAWWQIIILLTQVVVAMSGWIAYRYRQTRALTLAQILETRYSKRFRIFAGLVIFVSGTLNFGIFPAVAARFFQYYWGLGTASISIGFMSVDLVYAGLMLALTVIALFFIFIGGQITIMITDFIQGTFANVCLVAIVIFLLVTVSWGTITTVVGQRDHKEFEPTVAVAVNDDYAPYVKLGKEEDMTKKFNRASKMTTKTETKEVELVSGKKGEMMMIEADSKGPKSVQIVNPETIIYRVQPKEVLLPGTDYNVYFTYKSDNKLQYHLIVLSEDGRMETLNYVLPTTHGKEKLVGLSFTSTNIGTCQLVFAKAFRPVPEGTTEEIVESLQTGGEFAVVGPLSFVQKENQSMIHPFKSGSTKDFDMWYFLIQALIIFWTFKAWQGTQGYYGAALNAHEARMGGVIGNWRIMSQNMMVLLIPVAAYTLLYNFNDPQSQAIHDEVTAQLANLPSVAMQNQLRTTITLTQILPIGLLGAFSAVMMAAFIGTNGTYMHSWGSIFVQDILMPFRKNKAPLTPKQHLRILRWSIAGVGIFAFFFSLVFEPSSSILMYFALTGTMWLGGAGAVIALGLYWKRGTTAGAYTAIITGMVVAITTFLMQQGLWEYLFNAKFPLNNQWMMFVAMASSTVLYVVVSLLTCRQPFNLDRMLHRGEYATEDSTASARQTDQPKKRFSLKKMFGINEDFSQLDKVLYIFVTSWSFVWSGLFIIGLTLNYFDVLTLEHWMKFWHIYIIMAAVLGIITTVWFTIGGCVDMADLLKRLKSSERSAADDGSVHTQQNLDDDDQQNQDPTDPQE